MLKFCIDLREVETLELEGIVQEIETILQERNPLEGTSHTTNTNNNSRTFAEAGVQTIIEAGVPDNLPNILGGTSISSEGPNITENPGRAARVVVSRFINPGNTPVTIPAESERIITFTEIDQHHPDFRVNIRPNNNEHPLLGRWQEPNNQEAPSLQNSPAD